MKAHDILPLKFLTREFADFLLSINDFYQPTTTIPMIHDYVEHSNLHKYGVDTDQVIEYLNQLKCIEIVEEGNAIYVNLRHEKLDSLRKTIERILFKCKIQPYRDKECEKRFQQIALYLKTWSRRKGLCRFCKSGRWCEDSKRGRQKCPTGCYKFSREMDCFHVWICHFDENVRTHPLALRPGYDHPDDHPSLHPELKDREEMDSKKSDTTH